MMPRKGFTLIEIVAALAISAIIGAGVWKMARGGVLSFVRAQGQADVINNGERALRGASPQKGLLKDIRRCASVESISAGQLSLLCPDGALKYALQDTDLVRVAGGSSSTVARNITSLGFRYFKIDAGVLSLTTQPERVSLVEINSLQVQNRGLAYSLTASARLRNR
jgi:prepilin-type N-terminal cleavage/methylation domain-containing protein